MNHLIAKLKGVKSQFVKVMSSVDAIIDLPNLDEFQQYSPSYKLENDEWFVLDNFTNLGYKNDLLITQFSSTNFNQITTGEYEKIEYLCCTEGNVYLFQKMFSTQFLSKRWFQISDEPTLHINQPIIVLNNYVDAVYKIADNQLYFKDIARVKSIFKGIEELYREATNEEVEVFLQQDFIGLVDGFSGNSVKTANRKRIAQTIDALNQFSASDKQTIFEYIHTYCEDVPLSGDIFQVGSEDHLKKILFGVEQRYYTTPLGSEKRLANSVIAI